MTRYKVRPTIPRTRDPRETERWERLVAKLANTTSDDVTVLAAGGDMPVTVVAVSYSVLATDRIVKATAAVTLTLPTAVGLAGKEFRLDNAHSGNTTLNPTGTQTIEGETSQTLSGQCCMVVYSDGSNWRIS